MNRRKILTLGLTGLGLTGLNITGMNLSAPGIPHLGTSAALAQSSPPPMPPELRDAIERQPFSPVLGNPNGNLTLTEFFDYNCPVCKNVPAILQKLIAADKDLRIVLREWPVLAESSEMAARASLASLKQDKYWQFHQQLMSISGQLKEASIMRAADRVGLDRARLTKDMQSDEVSEHIWQSLDLGDHMGLSGTPTFIAGNDGAFGHQTYAQLKELISQARRALL